MDLNRERVCLVIFFSKGLFYFEVPENFTLISQYLNYTDNLDLKYLILLFSGKKENVFFKNEMFWDATLVKVFHSFAIVQTFFVGPLLLCIPGKPEPLTGTKMMSFSRL
jgi:hypothetical protein